MARNVEIKARIANVEEVARRVSGIVDANPTLIEQDDTFFACEAGRLKLRAFSATSGELIFYKRADQAGPKESYYLRTPTVEPNSLRALLSEAYGEVGRVRKQRTLFLIGRTRVHLDVVEQLGHFLELEVVLREGESAQEGVREAEVLMARLGIEPAQLIDRAYVDLLKEQGS